MPDQHRTTLDFDVARSWCHPSPTPATADGVKKLDELDIFLPPSNLLLDDSKAFATLTGLNASNLIGISHCVTTNQSSSFLTQRALFHCGVSLHLAFLVFGAFD